MPYCGKRFLIHQIPTSCLPTSLIFIHIEHTFCICPVLVAFFSATIDGRNLIFGHKLHIGTPYCGKRFLTCQIPTSCLPKSGGINFILFILIHNFYLFILFLFIFLGPIWLYLSNQKTLQNKSKHYTITNTVNSRYVESMWTRKFSSN
jgi:hypothetical protein